MASIYCIGSVNVDQVCVIGTGIGESRRVLEYERRIAGKGLNQAEAVRRAGGAAAMKFFGKVGREHGYIVEELSQRGFPTDSIRHTAHEFTGHVFINKYEDGSPDAMNYYYGANACITIGELEGFLGSAKEGDILLVQNEVSAMRELLALARQKGMRVCFNPSPGIDADWDAGSYACCWLIVNEHEFRHLHGLFKCSGQSIEDQMQSVKSVLQCDHLICTLGPRGAVGIDMDGRTHHADALPVAVVDTVGAGDCFAGYFIASVWKGCLFAHALRTATVAASLKVQQRGAFDGIPFMEQVEEHLACFEY